MGVEADSVPYAFVSVVCILIFNSCLYNFSQILSKIALAMPINYTGKYQQIRKRFIPGEHKLYDQRNLE